MRRQQFSAAPLASARGPDGSRAYAIGDVHGRLDTVVDLLDQIEADIAESPPTRTFIVFLGDLIDRGPASREVVEFLRTRDFKDVRPIFLSGNHEEIFLRVLDGETNLIPGWLGVGGYECCLSYGVTSLSLLQRDIPAICRQLAAKVPQSHVEFLRGFADSFRFQDYLFVHAGVRPGVAIEDQDPSDLRWIREEFLADLSDHSVVVVHGHTIADNPEEQRNRIGIDTGAYLTGKLTALRIDGLSRSFLCSRPTPLPIEPAEKKEF